ncbi:ABC transporter permease [Paraferrimonas haliotis]|uniref:Membrane protein NosY n=1 Tax=Paraferrimonas haliotis TaxID=2013866 RepID=A0AA37TMB4_9GAMM|nr:ABC transporter permease subunit [Paraferrimonas haliotis]GLS82238.1 membrane protein NosY [Paraferrimonas haliotis]
MKSAISCFIRKEISDAIRSRWLVGLAVLFSLIMLVIGGSNSFLGGEYASLDLSKAIISLAGVCVVIVPLICILLSYDSIVGEQETGTLLLLMAYPISRSSIVLGKFIGKAIVVGITLLIPIVLFGVYVSLNSDAEFTYISFLLANFFVSLWLLALVFILISLLVSTQVKEKAKALSGLFFIWFCLVLLWDLLILLVVVIFPNLVSSSAINTAIAINPVDVFRAINQIAVGDVQFLNGLITINSDLVIIAGYFALLAWVALLSVAVAKLFNRKQL